MFTLLCIFFRSIACFHSDCGQKVYPENLFKELVVVVVGFC